MPRSLDYHSDEYDSVMKQAERLGWNEDGLSSDDLEKSRSAFIEHLRTTYSDSDEVQHAGDTAFGHRR